MMATRRQPGTERAIPKPNGQGYRGLHITAAGAANSEDHA